MEREAPNEAVSAPATRQRCAQLIFEMCMVELLLKPLGFEAPTVNPAHVIAARQKFCQFCHFNPQSSRKAALMKQAPPTRLGFEVTLV